MLYIDENKYCYNPLTLGGVVLAANNKLAFPAGLYCGESLKSAGELAAEPPVPPLLIQKYSRNKRIYIYIYICVHKHLAFYILYGDRSCRN